MNSMTAHKARFNFNAARTVFSPSFVGILRMMMHASRPFFGLFGPPVWTASYAPPYEICGTFFAQCCKVVSVGVKLRRTIVRGRDGRSDATYRPSKSVYSIERRSSSCTCYTTMEIQPVGTHPWAARAYIRAARRLASTSDR